MSSSRGIGCISVGPHEFVRLTRFLHRDKCRACYLPKDAHPVNGWTRARPMGDASPARMFEVEDR